MFSISVLIPNESGAKLQNYTQNISNWKCIRTSNQSYLIETLSNFNLYIQSLLFFVSLSYLDFLM